MDCFDRMSGIVVGELYTDLELKLEWGGYMVYIHLKKINKS